MANKRTSAQAAQAGTDSIKTGYRFSRLLVITQRRWSVYLDKRLSVLGLTSARWRALVEVSKSERALNQRELADRIGIEGASLVQLLDGLEQRELIRRVADENDRRTKRIEITASGRGVLSKISQVADDVRAELLVDVSNKDLEIATNVLESIFERLDENADVRERSKAERSTRARRQDRG